MDRVNVYADPDPEQGDGRERLVGWFDKDTATVFGEDTWWNGHNHISEATGSQWDHEELLRTPGGRWVLHEWSQRQGSRERWSYATDNYAREWLLRNHHDQAAERYFGPIPAEHGPEVTPPAATDEVDTLAAWLRGAFLGRVTRAAAWPPASQADVDRWRSVAMAAMQLGAQVHPERALPLEGDTAEQARAEAANDLS